MTAALHVAAMPFPSPQGTQAAIASMMDALAASGQDAHLLVYGDEGPPDGATRQWTLHRAPAAPGRASLRSGPSVRKLLSNGALVPVIRRFWRSLGRPPVVAHHVEATAACLAARVAPVVFFAHTSLEAELPTYGPRLVSGAIARAGRRIDAELCSRAAAVVAVSPALCDLLRDRSRIPASYVPIPWMVSEPTRAHERIESRSRLGLAAHDEVVLYAGNLDRYQSWEHAVDATARAVVARRRARLLVATASDAAPLVSRAMRVGLANRIVVTPLGNETIRRRVHAAADVAVVPRRAAGGLPVKLLDALARGVPTVAASRATAGLDLAGGALIVADDDPDALANGIRLALGASGAAREIAARGRAYVASDHHPAAFVEALADVLHGVTRG